MKTEKAEGEILGILLILCIVIGIPVLLVGGFVFHWFGSAADVVQHETDPHTMLTKYRLMLTQQNSLEELKVNIISSTKLTEADLKEIEDKKTLRKGD